MSPSLVNGQITDAVTQTNTFVLGNAPAQAVGMLYQMMAHAAGLSMQNAVAQQRNMNTISTAVTTSGVNGLYGLPLASEARGVVQVASGNALAASILELAAALKQLAEKD